MSDVTLAPAATSCATTAYYLSTGVAADWPHPVSADTNRGVPQVLSMTSMRPMTQQCRHDLNLRMEGRHVQTGVSLPVPSELRVHFHTMLQKEVDDAGAAVGTRYPEGLEHVDGWCFRSSGALFSEEGLHGIEPAQTCCG